MRTPSALYTDLGGAVCLSHVFVKSIHIDKGEDSNALELIFLVWSVHLEKFSKAHLTPYWHTHAIHIVPIAHTPALLWASADLEEDCG